MDNFEFQFPWALTLFVPLLIALWIAWKRKEPSLRVPAIKRLPKNGKNFLFSKFIPFLFYALAGIFLVLALAGPRYDAGEVKQRAEGTDIMIAIDLSASMGAYDPAASLKTDSAILAAHKEGKTKMRLDVCKEEIKRFIEARPSDRIGLIAFANLPYAICPPTLDHAWLIKQVNSLKLNSVGTGTGLASPIISVVDRTKNSDAKRKVMLLFTDGANSIENKVTPEQAAQIAAQYNLTVHTVGIGSPRAYIVQEGFLGKQLMPYPHEFDEALLKKIAATTKGQYYSASDRTAMREALADIDKLEKKTEETPKISLYENKTGDFAGFALLSLLIAFLLSRTIFLRFP